MKKQPTILCGDSLSDIHEWLKRQNGMLTVDSADVMIFEESFAPVMGSMYENCWRQIPAFYKFIICKTSDSMRCAPATYTFTSIGRSVRITDRGALLATEYTHEEYMYLLYVHTNSNRKEPT